MSVIEEEVLDMEELLVSVVREEFGAYVIGAFERLDEPGSLCVFDSKDLFEGMEGVLPVIVAEDRESFFVMEKEVGGVLEYVVAAAVGVEETGEIKVFVIVVIDEMEGESASGEVDEQVPGLKIFSHGLSPF